VARSAGVAQAGLGALLMATLQATAIVLLLLRLGWLPWPPATAAALAVLPALGGFALCYQRFRARAGGITGDFLGACQQLTEIAVLVACAAVPTS
jgi:adenosylcobinamide-GDP ribazoletransferase